MNEDIERELTMWMQQQADQTRYDRDLMPSSIRRGRQMRRRRVGGVVAAALVLTLAVPLGAQASKSLFDPRPTGGEVATTPSATSSDGAEQGKRRERRSSDPAVPTVDLDFGNLQRGTSGAAWWDADRRVIVNGDNAPTRLDSEPLWFGSVALDGGYGYAVIQETGVLEPGIGRDQRLEVVTPQDSWTLAEGNLVGATVSADQKRIAWAETDGEGDKYSVHIAEAAPQESGGYLLETDYIPHAVPCTTSTYPTSPASNCGRAATWCR